MIYTDKTGDAEPDPTSARAADQIRQTPTRRLDGRVSRMIISSKLV